MDKLEFIRLAPAYYHAAILLTLKRRISGTHFTISNLKSALVVGNDEETYLLYEQLINISLGKLLTDGAITKVADPFGEPLYSKTDKYDQVVEEDENDPSGPYRRNAVANDHNFWLRGALRKVNEQYFHLGMTPDDFAIELPDEWAPIQINPDEPAIQEAVRQLQEVTTAIEQDNGYSATYPQERDQIVQDLKGGLEKLKSSAVSVGWLRGPSTRLRRPAFVS